MTLSQRKQMLAALDLVDWQPRADGPLGQGVTSPEVSPGAGHTAVPDHVDPLPARHRAARSGPRQDAARAVDPNDTPASQQAIADAGDQSPSSTHTKADYGPVSSMDWQTLEAWLDTRDHRGATRAVFGIGARDADVLIVGEAPGANEDAQGVPFVGRAGQLLDRMLFAIGCSRDTNVYITNICKFRPPGNRDPNADEVAADWPILERQIELMNPRLVVAVGRVAAQTLLSSKATLGKLRGQLHRYPGRDLDVLVTYHPAFLLRSPGQKAKAWMDLKQIARRIART